MLDATANPSIWEYEIFTVGAEPTSVALGDDAVALEWQNTPGVSYSVQRSTHLLSDPFSTTIESGIPSMGESNRIVIETPGTDAAFYRIVVE